MTPEDLYQTFFVLTSNQRRLRAQGVVRSEPGAPSPTAAVRFARTWHSLPFQSTWVPSIGCWGGVRTFEEIRTLCGSEPAATKSLMHRFSLKAASNKGHAPRHLPQRILALRSYLKWRSRPEGAGVEQAAAMAAHLHILPVEFKLYIECVRELIEEANEYQLPEVITQEVIDEHLIPMINDQWWAYEKLLREAAASYSERL